jgi:hypothetical protein
MRKPGAMSGLSIIFNGFGRLAAKPIQPTISVSENQ